MEGILSGSALEEYRRNGFVRPGISLSPTSIKGIRELFQSRNAEGSSWSYFFTLNPRRAGRFGYWITNRWASADWRPKNRKIHRDVRRHKYTRSLFGTSRMLAPVVAECLAQGLGKQLKANHLLVSQDYFLENSSRQTGFGVHEDGWNVETFYETDDDMNLYVQLQDATETTGGRLMVDQGFRTASTYRNRNRVLKQISDLCERAGCLDDDGYASREAVKRCGAVMEKTRFLQYRRSLLPKPKPHDMFPIDARAGELILFNPKSFHSNEAWASRNAANRMVYAIRLMPLYDVKLRPPMSFLKGSPCNRYILDTKDAVLLPMDNQSEQLRRYCIPLPRPKSHPRTIAERI